MAKPPKKSKKDGSQEALPLVADDVGTVHDRSGGEVKTVQGHSFIEYTAPDGNKWRAEEGMKLVGDFEMEIGDMPDFHKALVGEGKAWMVIKRLYRITPLLGDVDMEDLKVWTIETLAAAMTLSKGDIEGYIAGAKVFWRKTKLNKSLVSHSEKPASKQVQAGSGLDIELSAGKDLSDEQVEALLTKYHFEDVKGDGDRLYVAEMIIDYTPYLEDEQFNQMARNVIRTALLISFIDKQIAQKMNGGDTDKDDVMRLAKQRADLIVGFEKTLSEMGATDVKSATIQKRMAFVDCLSMIIEAVRLYQSDENTELIDGVFTAAEIKILTEPMSLRPAQYRPDIVVAIHEAMENIWNKDYEGSKLNRDMVRRLRKGFGEGMKVALSEENFVPVDMDSSDEDNFDAVVNQAAPSPAMMSPGTEGAAAVPQPQRPKGKSGDEEVW